MKIFRYRDGKDSKPGLMINNTHFDVSEFVGDIDRHFFENDGLSILRQIREGQLAKKITEPDFASPIYRPGKLVCIGLNYQKHAAESGMGIPKEPVIFFKATSSICGPFDDVIIPKGSKKTDWEVELAVIIGKKANYVSREEAMEYVAGYTIHNDVSEREYQLERGGQWVKGKSCDTFAPLGPYIVSKDEIKDPHRLNLWLTLNGEKLQDGSTADFIFDIPEVISYLSRFMSLEPGDIISTGTPEGVGLGFSPPRYLKDGDIMELGIEGLGASRQVAKNYPGL